MSPSEAGGPRAEETVLAFPLRPMPWLRWLGPGAVVLPVTAQLSAFAGMRARPWLAAALTAAGLLAWLLWVRRWPAQPDSIECGPGWICVPSLNLGCRARRWSLDTLHSVHRAPFGQLVIAFRGSLFPLAFRDRHFVERGAIDRLEAWLLQAMARGIDPQVAARRREIARRGWVIPWLCGSVAATLAAVFAIEVQRGALASIGALLDMGASSSVLVAQGEGWRVVSGAFLHASPAHYLSNACSLLALGCFLEGRLGRWRTGAALIAGVLGGGTLSALMTEQIVTVGASTAVYGLVGATVVLLRFHADLPETRSALGLILGFLAVDFALGALRPYVDWVGHAGGFAGGAAVTLALTQGLDLTRAAQSQGPWLRSGIALAAALLGLAALYGLSGTRAVDAAALFDELEARSAQRPLRAQAALRNAIAWTVATNPDAPRADLERARVSLEQIEESTSLTTDEQDTLAALRYRLRDLRGAVIAQREAVGGALDDRQLPEHWTRLAFYAWRLQQADPQSSAVLPGVRVERTDARVLQIAIESRFPNGLLVLAVAERDGELLGFYLGAYPPDPRSHAFALPEEAPADAQLRLVHAAPMREPYPASLRRYLPMQDELVEFLESR